VATISLKDRTDFLVRAVKHAKSMVGKGTETFAPTGDVLRISSGMTRSPMASGSRLDVIRTRTFRWRIGSRRSGARVRCRTTQASASVGHARLTAPWSSGQNFFTPREITDYDVNPRDRP
jgi:hypothetical protein